MSLRLHQSTWPAAALDSKLSEHDAVICTASLLDADAAAMVPLLSPKERSRFDSHANEVVARRYLCGRARLRTMLGAATGIAPGDVPLREGPLGKPYLAAGCGPSLWFSLSHCDDLFVLAMSRTADVGVDVEQHRAFEHWQRVADRVLDVEERRQLDRAVAWGDDPGEAFLRHWCRVEAELKAVGCGIDGLERHRAGIRPRGLRLHDLRDLPLPPDIAATGARYQAAVALCTPGADNLRQMLDAARKATSPATRPASASTP